MGGIQSFVSHWIAPLRGRLMIALVLVVGLYFVLSFGEQAWHARQLEEDVAQRQEEIAELRQERDELASEIEQYQSDQYDTYVEQIARRDLNLAYPGETVLLVRWSPAPEQPNEETTQPPPSTPQPNWQEWIDFLWS